MQETAAQDDLEPAIRKDAIPAIADDGSLYPVGKMEAHERNLLHQAVSVFVFSDGDLLIQKRAMGKYHSGGLWANTCCSHPHWGEELADCARRRLAEEVGLVIPLTRAGTLDYAADVGNGLYENERVAAFTADLDRSTVIFDPNPAEVSDLRWVSLDDLRQEVADTPEGFAPWLRIYLSRWAELEL